MVNRLINKIKKHLTDDLRLPQYRNHPNPAAGHCYVASEAFYWLSSRNLKPMFIRHEGQPHWFLKDDNNKIIDITASQFKTPIPYEKAIGKGFLTKKPSKRCQILLGRIKSIL